MEQIDVVYELSKKYPNRMEIALTSRDVKDIFLKNRIASLIGMEGGHSIGSSIKTLRSFYKLGARYMTLTHSCNTPWADSSGDIPTNNLTKFGEEIILEMNKLGMIGNLFKLIFKFNKLTFHM
jgi:membrane dipeptidase